MSWTEKIVSMTTTSGICAETMNVAVNAVQVDRMNRTAACSPYHSSGFLYTESSHLSAA